LMDTNDRFCSSFTGARIVGVSSGSGPKGILNVSRLRLKQSAQA